MIVKRLIAVGVAMLTLTVLSAEPSRAGESSANGDWTAYGRTPDEQRFSPLVQINPTNVKQLGLAWSIDLPRVARSLEGTPLAIEGTLYFTTGNSDVYAVDAETGKQMWYYDPQVWRHSPRALRTSTGINRGLAYGAGAVIVGAADGRLIAVDAETGKEKWIADTVEKPDSRKQITGAPRVFGNKVIIGHAGADFGTRGYVTTYDVNTGRKLWRFFTVPGDPAQPFEDDAMKMAAATWTGEWYKWGGGGTVWNGITYDPEFNRIYIGVGNSSNYNPRQRSPGGGDNLFLASIVALDAETGKYIWHYQVNPREAWDFKAVTDMVLADLDIDGNVHKVLMQAPTNGFFYVIDRKTGKLISAEKLGKVTWADRIDLETGRPVEMPNVRYEEGPVTFWPSPWGVHNWQAMSFSPQTGLVYVPTMKLPATYSASEQDWQDAERMVVGTRRYWFGPGASFITTVIEPDDGTGALVAWDPVEQKPRWTVKHETIWNGGTLVTESDLVFQGTGDGGLHAYRATDGEQLWRFQANHGIIAPPITYLVDGMQYVTVLAGYGGITPPGGKVFDPGWRYGKHSPQVLTFKIGGTARLRPAPGPDFSVKPIDDPTLPIDTDAAARGGVLWNQFCIACHGIAGATAGTIAPDLRESAAAHNPESLSAIVRKGALLRGGMPQFDELSNEEIRDLQMYIRQISRDASARPEGPSDPLRATRDGKSR